MKMNNIYLPDGFPNTPDVFEAGGNYTAGDGIAISAEKVISVAIGDGLAINESDEIVADLGDGLALDESDKIVPDVDGTTIGINETTKKLECLLGGGGASISTDEVDTGWEWFGSKVYAKAYSANAYCTKGNWGGGNNLPVPTGLSKVIAAFATLAGSYGGISLPIMVSMDQSVSPIHGVSFQQLYFDTCTVETICIFYTKTA